MNDTNKIRLIKAYTELINVAMTNASCEGLSYPTYNETINAKKHIINTVIHLSKEVQKLTFDEDDDK